jgi:predicted AAA+ superfamily ATPase
MWIKRIKVDKIINGVKMRPSVLLTGIRQVGKSSLLKYLFPKAEYVTLDRVAMAEEAENNPIKFLDRFKGQVIIDEVQYAPSLFRELKIRIDEDRDVKGKWILTGSQQFSLMQNISESLAGRIRILTLGTLSSRELQDSGLLKDKRDMLWKGGFPELWAQKLDVEDFYEDYFQTYIERDLRQLLRVSNLGDFRRFLSLLALRVGQLINYSEISKEVGVSVNTIKSWVNTLEISGVISLLPPYYNNLGKRLIKSPKLYFSDTGLASYLLNITSLNALDNSSYLGSIWENYVLAELLKEGFQVGKDIFFYRDQNGVEIDFILEVKGNTFLIEAKSNERVNENKLNFRKVIPLFKRKVIPVLACGVEEDTVVAMKSYRMYNPLFGIPFRDIYNG